MKNSVILQMEKCYCPFSVRNITRKKLMKLNRCHVCVWYSDLCVHICGATEQLLND